MYHFLWLIHIVGIILWLGGLSTAGLLLVFTRRESNAARSTVVPIVLRGVTPITHTGAALVLIGGIPMLFMLQHSKLSQFWIQYMGGVGVIVIVLGAIMLTVTSRKITKSNASDIGAALKVYLRWLYVIVLLTLSVLVVVAFK